MHGEGESDSVPPVLRDAGEVDDEVYVVGVRESTDPQAWSLLFMECNPDDKREMLSRGLRRVLTSGRADAIPQLRLA